MISWFFFWGIVASETEFSKKTPGYHTKKKISCNITFSFFGQIAPILGGKKKGQNGEKWPSKKSGDAILNVEEIRGGYYSVFLVEIGEFFKFAKL